MSKTIISLIAAAILVPALGFAAEEAGPGKAAAVSKTFKVGADCKIMAGDKAGALADLKVGDKVGILYKEDGGANVANHIRVLVAPKADAPKGEGHKGGHHAAAGGADKAGKQPEGLRAHGAITAVDAAGGTITVDVMARRAEAQPRKH